MTLYAVGMIGAVVFIGLGAMVNWIHGDGSLAGWFLTWLILFMVVILWNIPLGQ